MKQSKAKRYAASVFFLGVLLVVAGCGDDSGPGADAAVDTTVDTSAVDTATADTATADTTTPDTGSADTAVGDGGTSSLGQLCGTGLPACPVGYDCAIWPLIGGSTTQGHCTPNCSTGSDCTDGYNGPGSPSCFTPPKCIITCTAACPAGLTCLPTGGPTSACGVAQ